MKKFLFSLAILATCLQLHAQSWSLTGNSGTTPGTNFLGTSDSKALVFKVNKQWSGYIDFNSTKANTSFGFQAAKNNKGTQNAAFGYKAFFSNTSGTGNTAAGTYALYSNTSGYYNTGVGELALYDNITGRENTAVGYGSLLYNTTGYFNTATGYSAMSNNSEGLYNTANGALALSDNTTGYYNTSLGADALHNNTSGSYNTAAGSSALYRNTGNYNTGIGYNALGQTSVLAGNTPTEGNTAIGYNAGGSYNNGFYNVFVGANVDVTGDGFYNVIAIGQGTVCTDVSQVTIGNGATATYRAYANWSNISDGRFKKNIKENVPGLAFINKLQPITYTLDATGIDNFLHKSQPQDKKIGSEAKAVMNKALVDKEKTVYTGFVAQDVEKAAKSLNYDFSGVDAAKNDKDVYGLRYAEFVVPLVKAVQELSKKNDELGMTNDELKKQNDDLAQRVSRLETMMNVQQSNANNKLQITNLSSASLSQNIPNPFQNSTAINYSLPQQFSSAQIIITDKSGKVLKQIAVSGNGKGSVQVNTSTLAAGAYQYSLYLNGKLIDTKQMVLAK